MKLQPFYRGPFDHPGFFTPVGRREAAHLLGQWRRNGVSVKRMRVAVGRGYLFRGRDGEDAAMVLKP